MEESLQLIFEENNEEKLKEFLKNNKLEDLNTPILFLALDANCTLPIYKIVLENTNCKQEVKETYNDKSVLQFALTKQTKLDIIQYLCSKGADPKVKDPLDESTLLHDCVESKLPIEYVKYFSQYIDIASVNEYEESALTYALSSDIMDFELLTLLIQLGSNLDTKNDENKTPLHIACEHDVERDLIELMIKKGSNLKAKDTYGNVPLSYLIPKRIGKRTLEIFLEYGQDLNLQDNFGNTLLHWACKNNLEIVDFLLGSGVDPNTKNKEGMSALHYLVGNPEVSTQAIGALLKNGLNPDLISTTNEKTALEILFLDDKLPKEKKGDLIKYLATKTDLNCKNSCELPLLCSAIFYEISFDSIKFIINQDPDFNARSSKKKANCLHYAAQQDNLNADLIELLIAKGANSGVKDIHAKYPLMYTFFHDIDLRLIKLLYNDTIKSDEKFNSKIAGHYYCIQCPFIRYDVLHFLHSNGADLVYSPLEPTNLYNAVKEKIEFAAFKYLLDLDKTAVNKQNYQYSTMHSLAMNGRWEMLEYALDNGGDIKLKNRYGKALLHSAVESNVETCELLIKRGVDINIKSANGDTAFHILCKITNIHIELFKFLLKNGASCTITNNQSMTPIHSMLGQLSSSNEQLLFQTLMDYGVDFKDEVFADLLHYLFDYRNHYGLFTVKFLLDQGIDPNRYFEKYQHPLSSAVAAPYSISKDIIKLLLMYGAETIIYTKDYDIEFDFHYEWVTKDKLQALDRFSKYQLDILSLYEKSIMTDFKIKGLAIHKIFVETRLNQPLNSKSVQILEKYKKAELNSFFRLLYSGNFKTVEKQEILNAKMIFKDLNIVDFFDAKISKLGLKSDMKTIYEDEDFKDFNIIVEKDYIPVNKFILVARSKLYKTLFETIEKEIDEVNDYSGKSYETLDLLIKYLYTDDLVFDADDDVQFIIEELEDAIDYYQLGENSNLQDILGVHIELNKIKTQSLVDSIEKMAQFRRQLSREASQAFSNFQLNRLFKDFKVFDIDGDGSITEKEIRSVLMKVGDKSSLDDVKNMIKEVDTDGNGEIEFPEFVQLMYLLKTKKIKTSRFGNVVKKVTTIKREGGGVHSYTQEEKEGLVDFINNSLAGDQSVAHIIPIDPRGDDIFYEVRDGILFAKIIDKYFKGTINMRRIVQKPRLNKFELINNLNLVLQASKKLGIKLVNIGPEDILEKREHLILGLTWQVVKASLMKQVSSNPNLDKLKKQLEGQGGRKKINLSNAPPEELLKSWFNYQLEKVGCDIRINNFTTDLKDSKALTYLLTAIDENNCDLSPLQEQDPMRRAELFLQMADKIGARKFINAKDIVKGNNRLMTAFLAQLFLANPSMDDSESKRLERELKLKLGKFRSRMKDITGQTNKLRSAINRLQDELDREKRERLELEKHLKNLQTDLIDQADPNIRGLLLAKLREKRKGGIVDVEKHIDDFLKSIRARFPDQPEYIKTVERTLKKLRPFLIKHPEYAEYIKEILEPENIIEFDVPWVDDRGKVHKEKGYFVQHSSALGDYNGAIQFDPETDLGTLKALGLENALSHPVSTLKIGGGKGGSTFDPKNKSGKEKKNFNESFMRELYKKMGKNFEISKKGKGTGKKELDQLYDMYQKLSAGKGNKWGSSIHPKATGSGIVHITDQALKANGQSLVNKKVALSGFNDESLNAADTLIEKGAIPITLSDETGFINVPNGLTKEQIKKLKNLKEQGKPLREITRLDRTIKFIPNKKPFNSVKCDVAIACQVKDEISEQDAQILAQNGCIAVTDGARDASSEDAIQVYGDKGVLYIPSKLATLGSTAISKLELEQNQSGQPWGEGLVDQKLKEIMQNAFEDCQQITKEYCDSPTDYDIGAEISGFKKIADQLIENKKRGIQKKLKTGVTWEGFQTPEDFINNLMEQLRKEFPFQTEYLESVEEFLNSILPLLRTNPEYSKVAQIMTRPQKIIEFEVPWKDSRGRMQKNKGYFIKYNGILGDLKGGIEFDPKANESTMKSLGLDQTLIGGVTTLSIGGSKGGSDFNPKGKNPNEIKTFSDAYMRELYKKLGKNFEISKEDNGVDGKQLKNLYETYNNLSAGKGKKWGGAIVHPEATGKGLAYLTDEMLKANNDTLRGKKVALSGFNGNSIEAAKKLIAMGAIPITLSDETGTIHDPNGFTIEKLQKIQELKEQGKPLREITKFDRNVKFLMNKNPFNTVKCDIAMPCLKANEITEQDAQILAQNGCVAVTDGALKASSKDAIQVYRQNNILYAPSKLASIGDVAISQLELEQNKSSKPWNEETVDKKLKELMKDAFTDSVKMSKKYFNDPKDYNSGAIISGFKKIADKYLKTGGFDPYGLVNDLMDEIRRKFGDQPEYVDAVEEFLNSIIPLLKSNPDYAEIVRDFILPDKIIEFEVPWKDSRGRMQTNKGIFIQYDKTLGDLKGGIQFDPKVNLSVLKAFGLDQSLGNSASTLNVGGSKGGSDFNPKGKPQKDVSNFCEAYMKELNKKLGKNVEITDGEKGVSPNNLEKLYHEYNQNLKGKGNKWGGSVLHPEATGKGLVYATEEMLKANGKSLDDKEVALSGFNETSLSAAEKLLDMGAIPITLSDETGFIHDPMGFDLQKLQKLRQLKNQGKTLKDYSLMDKSVKFVANKKPFTTVKCDCVIACKEKDEITEEDSKLLAKNGCISVTDGTPNGSSRGAIKVYGDNDILYAPHKLAGVGAVAISKLELEENKTNIPWNEETVNDKLKDLMKETFENCSSAAAQYCDNPKDYQSGANIAGFKKIADKMIEDGTLRAKKIIRDLLNKLKEKYPDQPEFLKAVEEFLNSILPLLKKHPEYAEVLEQILEPENVLEFDVPWKDSRGRVQKNKGWFIQFNSALGDLKGGVQFDPKATLGLTKALGLGQSISNSLTGLSVGGSHGLSDFNPKGKPQTDVTNFCDAYMKELNKKLGKNVEFTKEGKGVDGNDLKKLYDAYNKNLQGKGNKWGGSVLHPEATGKGLVYITDEMLKANGETLKGKRVALSGFNGDSIAAAKKLIEMGAIPISLSDETGFVHDPRGFDLNKLKKLEQLKNQKKPLREITRLDRNIQYNPGKSPFTELKCDIAIACQETGEITDEEAKILAQNGCIAVTDGAPNASTSDAIQVYGDNDILYAPSILASQGAVAISKLEQEQNKTGRPWNEQIVDQKLKELMKDAFNETALTAQEYCDNPQDYQSGSNIAGFKKIADTMIDDGTYQAKKIINDILNKLKEKYPDQPEFLKTVEEFLNSLLPLLKTNPKYGKILEEFLEPNNILEFDVPWKDDNGRTQANKGWFIQFKDDLGNYKGGLQFDPKTNIGTIKSLGLDQTLANAISTLNVGGSHGGTDFEPKNKSKNEINRFCDSYMKELNKRLGKNFEFTEGGKGVGGNELFKCYEDFVKNTDGKGKEWGGAIVHPEATGSGLAYITDEMLKANGESIKGKKVALSGFNDDSINAAIKLIELGAIPITFSDENGTIHDPRGFDLNKIQKLKELKEQGIPLKEYTQLDRNAKYLMKKKPFNTVKCDIALPCLDKDEITEEDAQILANNGCIAVTDGKPEASTSDAIKVYGENGILYTPSRLATIGSTALAKLEKDLDLDADDFVTSMEKLLNKNGDSLKDKKVALSGFDDDSIEAAIRLIEFGAIPVSLSDENGTIHDPQGFDLNKLQKLIELKEQGKPLKQYTLLDRNAKYLMNKKPFNTVKCDIAMPCSKKDEITQEDAQFLANNGCIAVGDGTPNGSSSGAIKVYGDNDILYNPNSAVAQINLDNFAKSTEAIFNDLNDSLAGKKVALSGFEKNTLDNLENLIKLGAIPITVSDETGTIHDPRGFDLNKLQKLRQLKEQGKPLREYTRLDRNAQFLQNKKPFNTVACDIAMPCQGKNEITEEDSKFLAKSGCVAVTDGTPNASSKGAITVYGDNGILYTPSKLAVLTGFDPNLKEEFIKNQTNKIWTTEEADQKLKEIMKDAFANVSKNAQEYCDNPQNYNSGANIAGFKKIADKIIEDRRHLAKQLAQGILKELKEKYPDQKEYHKMVEEFLNSILPLLATNPEYADILKQILEPENIIEFEVPWKDSRGRVQKNKGWFIQQNSILGDFSGGIQFDPNTNLDTLKCLGFDQTLGSSLTTLNVGGSKGGSDFNPKGKPQIDVSNFCDAYMKELNKKLGKNVELTKEGKGVDGNDLKKLYDAYNKNLQGKGNKWGGSVLHPETTGKGLVYITDEMLKANGETLKGKRVALSGFNGDSIAAAKKLIEMGAIPISLSDETGFVHDPRGFDLNKLKKLEQLKNQKKPLREITRLDRTIQFTAGKSPFTELKCDIAIACQDKNEISEQDAKILAQNGCIAVTDGAPNASTNKAIKVYGDNDILYAPSKLSSQGAVAISKLEQEQNQTGQPWGEDFVDQKLKELMKDAFKSTSKIAQEYCDNPRDYNSGANIAGFKKIADKMIDDGTYQAKKIINDIMESIKAKYPDQPAFHKMVEDFLNSLLPLLKKHPEYADLLEELLEPENIIEFDVPWENDKGQTESNKGYFIQYNSALGDFKGGLMFDPTANLDTLKSLGLDQTLANALTTLDVGGSKGGSDFIPVNKSENEIKNFTDSYMRELLNHLGKNFEITKEGKGNDLKKLDNLYDAYNKMTAGKGNQWGGAVLHPDAEGVGLAFLTDEMLKANGKSLVGKTVALSGFNDNSINAAEKFIEMGALPITISDENGYLINPDGFDLEQLNILRQLKEDGVPLSEFSSFDSTAQYVPNKNVFGEVECDIAVPCMDKDEITEKVAQNLIENGCIAVTDGFPNSSNDKAIKLYLDNNVLYSPSKLATTGAVSISKLELEENETGQPWSKEIVDEKLKEIMKDAFNETAKVTQEYCDNPQDYNSGANIAAFQRIAEAMKNRPEKSERIEQPQVSFWDREKVFTSENVAEYLKDLLEAIKARFPDQLDFHNSVEDMLNSLLPLLKSDPEYARVLEDLLDPDNILEFDVPWVDDKGQKQVNKGLLIQFSNVNGDYSGALHFDPKADLGLVKALGLDQTLSHGLTTLTLGGAKGGSDFIPENKSPNEIKNFTDSFIREANKLVGVDIHIPNEGKGTNGELLNDMYKNFENLTAGEGKKWNGSSLHPEATGVGLVYLTDEMLKANGETLKGKKVALSGCNDTSLSAAEKLLEMGAIPITLSDDNGYIQTARGLNLQQLQRLREALKNGKSLKDFAQAENGITYIQSKSPFETIKCDIAMPCNNHGELTEKEAENLANNGCIAVTDGFPKASTDKAIKIYNENGILYSPGIAGAAGGSIIADLESTQNFSDQPWSKQEVDERLKEAMEGVFRNIAETAQTYCDNPKDYNAGAQISGFQKIADLMLGRAEKAEDSGDLAEGLMLGTTDLISGIQSIVQGRLDNLNEEMDKAQLEKDLVRDQKQRELNLMKDRYNDLTMELERAKGDKMESISNAERERMELENAINDLRSELEKAQLEKQQLDKRASLANKKLANEYSTLVGELYNQNQRNEELEGLTREKLLELERVNQQILTDQDKFEQDAKEYMLERERLIQEIYSAQNEKEKLISKSQEDIEKLAMALQELSNELDQVKGERDSLINFIKENLSNFEREKQDLGLVLSECEEDKQILLNAIQELKVKLDRLTGQNEELIVHVLNENRNLEQTLHDLEAHLKQLEQDKFTLIKDGENELDALRRRIKELEDKLNKYKSEIDIILEGTGTLEERLKREIEAKKIAQKRFDSEKKHILSSTKKDKSEMLKYVNTQLAKWNISDLVHVYDPTITRRKMLAGKKRWNPRKMVVKNGQLSLFKTEKTNKPERLIYLEGARVTMPIYKEYKRKFCILVKTSATEVIFALDSDMKQKKWVRSLKNSRKSTVLEERVKDKQRQAFQSRYGKK
ncbi:nadp-specific glutamate dehydrogenase 1-related [Anaeramoeba flamelloides]|uniref:glutamate dehydrogenase (NADP(+)) n=1 Tax=Anaeramoeba flamelloides TaxID=1746091 RepID=A0ABQ8X7N7_9EUKA|nr:nadp-specific glutamate dehydrogenase 1-related [Anaeramoeba flamelloides]